MFDVHLRRRARERLEIETALRHARERRELRVHYQPTIDLTTGKIAGAEALLRWQHPERGLLLPTDFLDLAEESGLLVWVGSWVLHNAAAQLTRWDAIRPGAPPLFVSVNLSARQLEHPALVEEFGTVLAATGVDPGRIDLEISESVVMRDPATTLATLADLKKLGVKLAVDDFGTGYSSLAQLRRFPVDILKVDRAFVDGLGRNPEDTAICAAVVTLAHTLGLQAIAEGVESPEQLAELRALGCDLAQGFHVSEAVEAEQIDRLLRDDPVW